MNKKKSLVCFTASYPYGTRETYLHTELKILSSKFDSIYLIPSYNPFPNDNIRELPSNVVFFPPSAPQGVKRIIAGIFNFSPLNVYMKDFFEYKVYKSKKWLFSWFNSFLVFRCGYSKRKSLLKSLDPANTVLYSYWAGGDFLAHAIAKDFKKVVRVHSGDFYLEQNYGYLPIRQQVYDSTDLLVPISRQASKVLQELYRVPVSQISVNYLGINNFTNIVSPLPEFAVEKTIRFVSCSNVIFYTKRIPLIIDLLKGLSKTIKVEWHHFGSGPDWDELVAISTSLDERIQVKLHGYTKPKDLFDFYENTSIDWFINLSEYDGIPVSIMEAFSYGIPAISTSAGAIEEIVNEKNGHLIPIAFDMGALIDFILNIDFEQYIGKKVEARNTWKARFNADVNYNQLANKLLKLTD